jgi:hypothetical protein
MGIVVKAGYFVTIGSVLLAFVSALQYFVYKV